MQPWLETLGVLLLAVGGAVGGYWLGRRPAPWWLAGYVTPLLIIISIGCARHFPRLELVPPFEWFMRGRVEFALTPLLGSMILATLLPRIPRARDKGAVILLMVLATLFAGLPVFLGPALNRAYLLSLETNIAEDGVCRQSNDYSCGPAAAVTALRALGLPAEEGEIAILAHTSRFMGTETDILAEALQKRYGPEGVTARYRHFNSVKDLKGPFITIARIKFGLLLDHYITVIGVSDDTLLVADPLSGLQEMTHAEFSSQWRFTGVTLSRKTKPIE